MADRRRGGKTTPGNGQAWVHQVPEANGEQRRVEKTYCEVVCGAPTTSAVKRKV